MNQHDTLVTEFDCKTTGGSTQLIKAVIPLLTPTQQRMLAIMTRIWELIMTIKFFEKNCFQNSGAPLTSNLNPEMLNRVKRYCTPESQQTIDMLLNFMNMSELMNMMNMFNGEDASGAPADIMNLFKNFGQFTTPTPESPTNTAGPSMGSAKPSGSATSSGPSMGSAKPFGPSMDPTNLMQTMMNSEQSQLYQEFMAKLDLDFNE